MLFELDKYYISVHSETENLELCIYWRN